MLSCFSLTLSFATVSKDSDWVAYAEKETKDISFLSSKWEVPPAPKDHGPAGLSSVYIFNGLEDGNGQHGTASYIMQVSF